MSEYTIPPRPTVYNGTPMRSRLEAKFAGWLDKQGREWTYEQEAFATGQHQWLPDFSFFSETFKRQIVVDVKPAENFVTIELIIRAQRTTWANYPDHLVVICWPDPENADWWMSILMHPDQALTMGWLPRGERL